MRVPPLCTYRRRHAELVTYDSEVVAQFSRHCYVGQDEELGR